MRNGNTAMPGTMAGKAVSTIATSVMGLMKGCQFFRVHNVKGNARALQMAWAIMHS